jgi:hypothetical protein
MLLGRGGCGKSEFIDFLKNIPEKERLQKFKIGSFTEMDDFPWLYELLKDEDIWEELGRPRALAERRGHVYITKDYDLYKFCTLKFNYEIKTKITPDFYKTSTLIMEFARGRDDGFKTAFELLDKEILDKSVIFFLDNTFEESMRRNTYRSHDNDLRQTILHHKVPIEVMEYYYKTNDWHTLTGNKPLGFIEVKGTKIPFVTVWNMPETHDLKELEIRYKEPLIKLWELNSQR